MKKLERNLLAEFFHKLAQMAFERNQWDVAEHYLQLANEVLR